MKAATFHEKNKIIPFMKKNISIYRLILLMIGLLAIVTAIAIAYMLILFYTTIARGVVNKSWPIFTSADRSTAADVLGQLGTLGDFIGGILNPTISLAALIFLIISIGIQHKQASETKKDLLRQQFDKKFEYISQILSKKFNSMCDQSAGSSDMSWLRSQLSMKVSKDAVGQCLKDNSSIYLDYLTALQLALSSIDIELANTDGFDIYIASGKSKIRSDMFFYSEIIKSHINRDIGILIKLINNPDHDNNLANKDLVQLLCKYQILAISNDYSWPENPFLGKMTSEFDEAYTKRYN